MSFRMISDFFLFLHFIFFHGGCEINGLTLKCFCREAGGNLVKKPFRSFM